MDTRADVNCGKTFRMNVATALNSKYVRYTCVMLTSLFINQPDAEIHVYLLHSGLTGKEQDSLNELAAAHHNRIHFLLIDKSSFPDNLPTTELWSLETYYRLKLLDIIPEDVDRLLYIDVDMIIDKPVRELYFTDFEDKNFCACRDMTIVLPFPDIRNEIFSEHLKSGNFTYFNVGLMLWNIEKLRGKYRFNDYMLLAEKLNYQLLAPDQDLLNYTHWNEVKFLDEYKYDLFSRLAYNNGIRYKDVKRETVIVHFAGMKPWEGKYIHYDIEQLWWDYARLTPYYVTLMEEFLYDCINQPIVYDATLALSNDNQNLRDELDKNKELCQKLLHLLEQSK